MIKCTKCGSQNYVKAGFKKIAEGTIQKLNVKSVIENLQVKKSFID